MLTESRDVEAKRRPVLLTTDHHGMALDETSKTMARYRSPYATHHGRCLDAVSSSVDLELMSLDEPLLPMDEPRAMDKFDWIEKILIVVSVSTVLDLLFTFIK